MGKPKRAKGRAALESISQRDSPRRRCEDSALLLNVWAALLLHAHHRRCRRYAAEKGVNDETAIPRGLEEKAAEFAKAGEVYQSCDADR